MTRAGPRRRQQTQPELPFVNSAQRKRVSALKRLVARARRVEREGLGPKDVACPHCGAPPFVSVRRDPGHCRTPGGPRSVGGPLPHHADHKARVQEAASQKTDIIRAGERARQELRRVSP